MKKVCDTFKVALDKTFVASVLTPALGVYHECLMVSMLIDEELSPSDKRKKLDGTFTKLDQLEKTHGPNSVRQFMHPLVKSQAAAVVFTPSA